MNLPAFVLAATTWLVLAVDSACADTTFQSTADRTHLLELYTSEGCSSCPPAEKWFSQLQQSAQLWKSFVPVAFHVDYWDGLGWPDRFASKAHTARQRALAAAWRSGSVYTPGFALDGAEWRARSVAEISAPGGKTGILGATVDAGKNVTVIFHPTASAPSFEAHVAVLGFGLSVQVKAGENNGRELLHDFVVLSHEVKPMHREGAAFAAATKLKTPADARKIALAVWVSETGKLEPVQAVGGLLAH